MAAGDFRRRLADWELESLSGPEGLKVSEVLDFE